MREYGRHVQGMVGHLLTIEDKERRQKNAQAVIELMGFLNPHLKNVEDFRHKLWDHLHIISDFKIDVEGNMIAISCEKEERKEKNTPGTHQRHPSNDCW